MKRPERQMISVHEGSHMSPLRRLCQSQFKHLCDFAVSVSLSEL